MIEKSAPIARGWVRERTSRSESHENPRFASVLQIAKFAPSSPHIEANFAIRTLACRRFTTCSTDLPGVRVGHAHDAGLASGVTAIVFDTANVASGVTRGGAPGTRDTTLLEPEMTATGIDVALLSGGSLFGLECGGRRGLPAAPAGPRHRHRHGQHPDRRAGHRVRSS